MRIMALLGDRVGDPLHTNREKIEISQVFIKILGFKELLILLGLRGNVWGIFGQVNYCEPP